jgi:hypothetical protein
MQTILNIENLHFDEESFDRFKAMSFEEPKAAIPRTLLNDFLTTVLSSLVKHKTFSVLPSTFSTNNCPMNTCVHSLLTTRGSALKFCNMICECQFVTSIGSNVIVRHMYGTALQNSNGELVDARCSQNLPHIVPPELLAIFRQIEKHCPFSTQGKEVANVCANFVVTCFKEDNNTKLKMTHSP